MWLFKKKKSILASRHYKIDRASSFRNPSAVKRKEWGKILFRVLNILLIVPIAASVYIVFISDTYRIRNIEISGTRVISAEDVLDIVSDYLNHNYLFDIGRTNLFIASKHGVAQAIQERYLVKAVSIQRVIPDTLRIHIEERQPAFFWTSGERRYLVDMDGVVIKEIFNPREQRSIFTLIAPVESNDNSLPDFVTDLIVVTEESGTVSALGERVINPDHIVTLSRSYSALGNLGLGSPTIVQVPSKFPQSAKIELDAGWYVLINLNDDPLKQMNRLQLVIQEKIKPERLQHLEYVDLKLGESVYYKFK